MGLLSEDEERKSKRPFWVKYICIAVCLVVLVLLAFALAYPLRVLFSDPTSDAIEKAGVKSNEIDDSAPDGFRASNGGFKREHRSTQEPPPSQPTPTATTRLPTTPVPTVTTQSPPTTSTAVTPSRTAATESSTGTVTKTRGTWRRHPRHVTVPPPNNRTNASGHKVHVWANRTRQVPSTITYEVYMKKVSVQVVYECHCPRSRRFIYSQLLPVYEKLRDYMHLTLLPSSQAGNKTAGNKTMGNKTTGNEVTKNKNLGSTTSGNKTSGNDSATDVECRRGKDECHSNMVQTCVLNHVEETLTAVKIIACMSRSPDPHRVGRVCVEKHGLQWTLIDACVTDKGKLYMLEVGKKAWSITGGVGNVPLVTVQGEMSYAIQVEAQTNLLALVCDHMKQDHKACAGSRNKTATSSSNESGENHTTAPHVTTTAPKAAAPDASAQDDGHNATRRRSV
uniref:Gamma-interferon inducible lysosomal thiol reductase n=1 Tax=Amblyomma triste TaxID=251400 RepID=A0A023GE70_AMBTT